MTKNVQDGHPPAPSSADQGDAQAQRRQAMVAQLRAYGVADARVLQVMARVPRHRFVPPEQLDSAYDDGALPIGSGQTISQPFIVAHMTELLGLSRKDRVLEIGTGSGYQAAVLAELAGEVYTIEIVPELHERARRLLADLGYKNVHLRLGDGYKGWPEHAPYTRIIATAAPEHVPQALIEQLAMDGKLVIPVGAWEQEMVVLQKTRAGLLRRTTIPVRFVPMVRKPP